MCEYLHSARLVCLNLAILFLRCRWAVWPVRYDRKPGVFNVHHQSWLYERSRYDARPDRTGQGRGFEPSALSSAARAFATRAPSCGALAHSATVLPRMQANSIILYAACLHSQLHCHQHQSLMSARWLRLPPETRGIAVTIHLFNRPVRRPWKPGFLLWTSGRRKPL